MFKRSHTNFIFFSLAKLLENGLHERQSSRIFEKKPICVSRGGKFVSVGIIDVQPALLLICWGFGISISIFATEFLLRRLKFTKTLREKIFTRGKKLSEE